MLLSLHAPDLKLAHLLPCAKHLSLQVGSFACTLALPPSSGGLVQLAMGALQLDVACTQIDQVRWQLFADFDPS